MKDIYNIAFCDHPIIDSNGIISIVFFIMFYFTIMMKNFLNMKVEFSNFEIIIITSILETIILVFTPVAASGVMCFFHKNTLLCPVYSYSFSLVSH